MNQQKYQHFKQADRDRLDVNLDNGIKQKEIARLLGKDPSAISREIKRNRRHQRRGLKTIYGPYEASVAEHKAYVRRKYAKWQGKKIDDDANLRIYIVERMFRGWSPDDISGRMRIDQKPFYASKNAIYRWLYHGSGQIFCQLLASRRYHPKKRKVNPKQKELIPFRISISERPEAINQRLEPGHFEADTIVSGKKTGSKTALAVAGERKFRYAKINKIKSMSPVNFNRAINDFQKTVVMKSATMDNGLENRKHYELGMATYFCDPYSSYQKGGVENLNGMIRRYIPKGVDIGQYSDEYVKMVEDTLNHKPRKSLGYQTPYECMKENGLLKEEKESLKSLIFLSLTNKKPEAGKLHFGGEFGWRVLILLYT
jgi:transposase, IS30 family